MKKFLFLENVFVMQQICQVEQKQYLSDIISIFIQNRLDVRRILKENSYSGCNGKIQESRTTS